MNLTRFARMLRAAGYASVGSGISGAFDTVIMNHGGIEVFAYGTGAAQRGEGQPVDLIERPKWGNTWLMKSSLTRSTAAHRRIVVPFPDFDPLTYD